MAEVLRFTGLGLEPVAEVQGLTGWGLSKGPICGAEGWDLGLLPNCWGHGDGACGSGQDVRANRVGIEQGAGAGVNSLGLEELAAGS